MGFVKMTCPNCGANFDMNGDLEFGVCNFCGTKIAVEKTIVEHRGSVSVKGVAGVDAILDRASLFLEDGNFDDALRYCEKALDIDPRNPEAYVLKLMAQKHCKTRSQLGMGRKPLHTYASFAKAFRFATPELEQELDAYDKKTTEAYKEEKKRRKADLEDLIEENNELQSKRNSFLWKYYRIFMPLVIVFGGIFIIGSILVRNYIALTVSAITVVTLMILLICYNHKVEETLLKQTMMINKTDSEIQNYKDWVAGMEKEVP